MSKIAYLDVTPGMPLRRLGLARAACVLLAVLAGYVLLDVSPALAGQARLLTGVFGTESSAPPNPYPLLSAEGVAADSESHDVYVVDTTGNRVEKFDSEGHFILMFGKEVDHTTGGDVCTAASGDVCQAGVAGTSPGAFEFKPKNIVQGAIAVDNSSVFGQQGDVYVSDYSLVSKFNSEGALISSWGNNGEGPTKNGPANGQLNGSNATGTVPGPFDQVEGLAVDPSGNLWVSGDGKVFEFRPNSSFATAWKGVFTSHIAASAEGNIYVGLFEVDEYTPEGARIGLVTGNAAGSISGMVVNQDSNELYVAHNGHFGGIGIVERFDASCHPHTVEGVNVLCTPVEAFGANNILSGLSLAFDSATGTLYGAEPQSRDNKGVVHPPRVVAFSTVTVPNVVTVKATGFTAGAAVLNGSVDPSGVELEPGLAGCRFEWGEHGAGENELYGHSAPCDKTAAQIGSGTGPVEVHASIGGLQQGHIYHFRLVAGNHNQINQLIDEPSLGSDLTFGPPLIENVSAIAVGADGATVQAQVDPNNVDTRIRVEYGTEAGVYARSTPELDLGAGGGGQLASEQLTGLQAATTYHYRVVAESALGEGSEAVIGSDREFTTQSRITGVVPPDGRVWELVSPPDKRGANPVGITESGMVIQASATGDAMTYIATAPTEAEPPGYDNGVQVLSRRTGAGWQSQDISVPHEMGAGASVGAGSEYRFFSTDLSRAIVQPFGAFDPRVSAEASEQTAYLRTDFPAGDVDLPCLVGCYRPLVTGAVGYENVPPETVFAQACEARRGLICGPKFVAATPDLSHVVLSSEVPLIEGAPAGLGNNGGSLYEWSGGRLSLVSVLPLPGGQPVGGATFGGSDLVTRDAISSDGSRIVWSTSAGLYVRDTVSEETVLVGGIDAQFQQASSDVSKVLFTEKGDLRECVIVESSEGLRCEITDLTPVGAGESPGVIGAVSAASEDLSYVYFVANAVLNNGGVPVAGAQAGACSEVATGEICNLYVLHDGTIRLVAELSSEDKFDWDRTLQSLTARVSPDGHWFAFVSTRPLTGYDNRDVASGGRDTEVYLYGAAGNGGEGTLICASCDPTGARPHGAYEPEGRGYPWRDGSIPGWTPYENGGALYQSRYLSDSGRLFFESTDALVPQDSNGERDVYEYEPPGVGDCTTASAEFTGVAGGCVGLISSGTSKEGSVFMDASEDGSDVFFLTASRLSRSDSDEAHDVYDARVGGGFAEPSPGPVCEGDACQSPVRAPEDVTPGSLTYSGPGNQGISPTSTATVAGKHKSGPSARVRALERALAACRRDRSKRARNRCVARARKRYGRASTGKAVVKKGKR